MGIKRSWLVVSGLLGLGSSLFAQTNVSFSDVVGYQTKAIASGTISILSIPFADAAVVATVSAVSSNSVTLQGQTSLGSLFNGTDPLYIEIVSGSLEGERYDVDLTGITTATSSLSVNTSSANNTATFAGSSLVGSTVAVRKHTTLNSLKSMFSPSLKTGAATTADLVYLFSSGVWTPYFLNTGLIWSRSGSLNNFNNTVIPPGSAVMVKRIDTSSTTFTASGTVRSNKFAKNYRAGLGVYSGGYPIAYSPNTMGATVAGGWTSGDTIFVLSGSTFIPYVYNGTNWKRTGVLSNFDAVDLLSSDAGILVKKSTTLTVTETPPANQ